MSDSVNLMRPGIGMLSKLRISVSCSALYMGLHPRLGSIVYGFALFLNGVFWIAAAAVAYYAIRLGNIQAHKEWMIRTYVLSWAEIVGDRIIPDMTFVILRIGVDALNDISGWANWAVPLMVTEVVLQLRRLRKIRRAKAAVDLTTLQNQQPRLS